MKRIVSSRGRVVLQRFCMVENPTSTSHKKKAWFHFARFSRAHRSFTFLALSAACGAPMNFHAFGVLHAQLCMSSQPLFRTVKRLSPWNTRLKPRMRLHRSNFPNCALDGAPAFISLLAQFKLFRSALNSAQCLSHFKDIRLAWKMSSAFGRMVYLSTR